MNVYLAPPDTPSRALDRVAAAFAKYPHPGITMVSDERAAQLVILQVVGRRDRVYQHAGRVLARGQQIAAIQYVLRSSQKPNAIDWIDLWDEAKVVWSYLDLMALSSEDGIGHPASSWFYHAPLGVEPDVFQPRQTPRFTTVLTSGRDWLTESVRECVMATQAVHQTAAHLGRALRGRNVPCHSDLPDDVLATLYSQCHYVSGLRRIEGFELPAAEGLLCGARPLLFDKPWYRHWYGGWADYIREDDRDIVIEQLIARFVKPVRKVTADEIEAAAAMFHWPTILHGFWERCLA